MLRPIRGAGDLDVPGCADGPIFVRVRISALPRFGLATAPVTASDRYSPFGSDGFPVTLTRGDQDEAPVGRATAARTDAQQTLWSRLWVGVAAGVPLTNDFPPLPPDSLPYTGQVRRQLNFRFLAGPMVEVTLTRDWSVEADGLYRRLFFRDTPDIVVTWEIPVLAKYTFSYRKLTPFVEAGPSFRLAGNLNYTNPSHYGVTVGAGIETHLWRVRITPALRYARWAPDIRSGIPPPVFTKLDQVELLVGFSLRRGRGFRGPEH